MFRLSDFRGRTGSLMTTFVLVAAGLLTVPALAEAVPGRYPTTAYSTLGVTALGLALFGGGVALSLLGRRRAR